MILNNDITFHISISLADVCYISSFGCNDFSYSLYCTRVRPTVGEDEYVTYLLRNEVFSIFDITIQNNNGDCLD